ncbi:MAG: type II toxin-antitoxin system Phd/YefM family antitoxin [Phycisphaeraceae bacterium]|nr:type II toxin-antitoxin system Phd/YefM family antitoxin [Phycisphaeraceae bacterium]
MTSIPSDKARQTLDELIDSTAATHEPVLINGKVHNAVLLSENDWRSVEETLYLLSQPGMRESIREGLATPLDKCDEDPGW